MTSLMEDIRLTNNLAKKNLCNTLGYGIFKTVYSFSNEDLINCFSNFDLNNKSILTVLGSSDQVLDMFLKGAANIDTFDINPLTKYYFYLKKAALSHGFPRDFFINFFNNYNIYNPYYMNYRTFNKFNNNIAGISYEYWQYVFDNFNPDEIAYSIFCRDSTNNHLLKRNINYLSNDSLYSTICDKIASLDIDFIQCDIRKINKYINKKYDYIYLSNIMQYADQMYNISLLNSLKVYKIFIEKLGNYLNHNGKIINYMFNYNMSDKRDILNTVFTSLSYEQIELNPTDGILVYTKKC